MLETLASWASVAQALLGIVIAFPTRRIPAAKPLSDTPPAPTPGASWKSSILGKFAGQAPTPVTPIRIPSRVLTPAEHFSRTAQVITSALRSANVAHEMHQQARIQLEVVEFSIDRILEEVADVMALTPEMQRRFKPALIAVPAAGTRRRAA